MQTMTEKQPVRTRSVTIDAIRGTAILLVLLGHSIQYGSGAAFAAAEGYLAQPLFRLIYSFHMPLFALISGWLFAVSVRKPAKTVLTGKLTGLLLPILSWNLLQAGGRLLLELRRGCFEPVPFVKLLISDTLYSFWFLWGLLLCSAFVLLVEKLLPCKLLVYGAAFVLCFFVPGFINFHLCAYLYPCFLAGFLAHRYSRPLSDRQKSRLLVGFGLCFGVLLLFFSRDSYIYTTGLSVLTAESPARQLGIDLYRWAVGLCGAAFVCLLCEKLCCRDSAPVRLLAALGRSSLAIYLMSTYIFLYFLVPLASGWEPHLLLWLAEAAVIAAVCMAAHRLLTKSRLLALLLFGQRKK